MSKAIQTKKLDPQAAEKVLRIVRDLGTLGEDQVQYVHDFCTFELERRFHGTQLDWLRAIAVKASDNVTP